MVGAARLQGSAMSRISSGLRTARPMHASLPLGVFSQRRQYQGNLQDKDRIFTNLYNDTSQFLDGAMKRVRHPHHVNR